MGRTKSFTDPLRPNSSPPQARDVKPQEEYLNCTVRRGNEKDPLMRVLRDQQRTANRGVSGLLRIGHHPGVHHAPLHCHAARCRGMPVVSIYVKHSDAPTRKRTKCAALVEEASPGVVSPLTVAKASAHARRENPSKGPSTAVVVETLKSYTNCPLD